MANTTGSDTQTTSSSNSGISLASETAAALTWDNSGERFYENGVDHVALYLQNASGAYPTGVAWNGVTGVTESPDGAEATDLYADNIKYATLRSAETFGFTLTAYTYPDEFGACDGTATPDELSGLYLGQQARNAFGLAYRTQIGNDTATSDDDGYKLHLVYGATASPSEKSYETINDSPDGIEFSWECTTTPVSCTGYKAVSTITLDSMKLGKTKMAAIEKVLYGSSEAAARLPLPDEVISIVKAAA